MPSYVDPTAAPAAAPPAAAAPLRPARSGVTPGSILVLLAGIIAVGVAIFLFLQVGTTEKSAQAAASDASSLRTQVNQNENVVAQAKQYDAAAKNLDLLFANQKDWPAVIDRILGSLYRRMSITSLAVDDKGTVTLSATTPTYGDYAKIYNSFQNPDLLKYFSNVKPSGVSKVAATDQNSAPSISFGFTFTLQKAIFDNPSTAPSSTPAP